MKVILYMSKNTLYAQEVKKFLFSTSMYIITILLMVGGYIIIKQQEVIMNV